MKTLKLATGIAIAFINASLLHAQSGIDAVNFEADHSIVDEQTLRVTMTGNVYLSTTDMELKANEVIVQLVDNGGNIDFSQAFANGNVWGRYEDIYITSNKLTYQDKGQYAVFTGNVNVKQGGNNVQSSEVRLNLENGVVELVGGIRGRITGSF